MMTSDRDNLISVNIARAAAALSVFVYHYGVGPTLAKYTSISAFDWISLPGAMYGVALFFVISGFCIHGSEWRRFSKAGGNRFDLKGYCERRFRRIYPAYLFCILLSCLLYRVENLHWPSLGDVTLHAFLLHGFTAASFNSINLVLWTISIEACLYAIYPLWLFLRIKTNIVEAFLIGTAISLISCVITTVWFYPLSIPQRWFFLNIWGGWLAGALLAETTGRSSMLYRTWWWWLAGLALCLICNWAESREFYNSRIIILKFPLRIYQSVWLLAAFLACEKYFREAKGVVAVVVWFFSAIGIASYSLYLLHVPVISIRNLIQSAFDLGKYRLPFQIFWFGVTLLVSWFSYTAIEATFMRRPKRMVASANARPATNS